MNKMNTLAFINFLLVKLFPALQLIRQIFSTVKNLRHTILELTNIYSLTLSLNTEMYNKV